LCPPISDCIAKATRVIRSAASALAELGRQEVAGFRCGASAFFNCSVPPSGTFGALVGQASIAFSNPAPQIGGGVSTVSRVVDAVQESGAEVKVHPTTGGEGVAIDFKDGTKIDVRVETDQAHGYHGNVQRWENGKQVQNTHVYPDQQQ
jgi:hypothetical protein